MGEIITFYSYKGGTGRSMALANTAVLLAKQNKRVMMIDWDLEAPGLDMYFEKYCPEIHTAKGLIEFCVFAKNSTIKMDYVKENAGLFDSIFKQLPNFVLNIDLPPFSTGSVLHLLKAGKTDDSYQKKIHGFNWQSFFKKVPAFFTSFAEYLSTQYDYVLIDSRTGHTDMSSICTALMPEKLVLVFTPNSQSLNGVVKVAKNATNYRLSSDDLRPLMIFPLPSRVDLAEEDLKKEWEGRYSRIFEELFEEIYSLQKGVSLNSYFSHVQIRYAPRMSYGEYISTLESSGSPNSLAENYEKFVSQLMRDSNIWEYRQMQSPFELTLVYDGKIEATAQELLNHLKPLERTDMLRWEQSNILPLDKLDTTSKRKITTKKENHLVLVLIDEFLQNNGNEWQRLIAETLRSENKGSTLVLPLWINSTIQEKTRKLFENKLFLPNRRTPLQDISDKDTAWYSVVSEIKKQINKSK